MCFEADDYPEFCDSRISTAIKPHRCTACRSVIAKGEQYRRWSGKHDGEFFTEKVCRRCEYDKFRVVEHELAEGCSWSEAWPPTCELVSHLRDSGLGQTKPDDVPASFMIGDLPAMPARYVVREGTFSTVEP